MEFLSAFLNAISFYIPQYTGLSPITFFTIAALVCGIYFLISGLFAPAPATYAPLKPLPPPRQFGEITAEDLRAYDGTDPDKPLLMAIKGQIYDVSRSRYVSAMLRDYSSFSDLCSPQRLNDLTPLCLQFFTSALSVLIGWEMIVNFKRSNRTSKMHPSQCVLEKFDLS